MEVKVVKIAAEERIELEIFRSEIFRT